MITGANGLIGSHLTKYLLKNNCEVNALQRGGDFRSPSNVKRYKWDPEKGQIDPEAFDGVDTIIHLAGAGIADKPWTSKRKRLIVESRTGTASFLLQWMKKNKHSVKTYVSASAIGIYGDSGTDVLKENRKPGRGFLAETCRKWEDSAVAFSSLGIREVRCRIGIVLSKKGGALKELTKTMPLGVAGYFLKPGLYYSWIHIEDVCGIMKYAIENESISGAVNTTAPNPVLMKELMREIIKAKGSSALLIPTLPVVIKLGLGEMSEAVLNSQRCSAEKIIESGYSFKYPLLTEALKNVYAS